MSSLPFGQEVKLTRKTDCQACELDGETVVLSVAQGAYFTLDEIATRVWQLLAKPITLDELVTTLTQEFEVSDSECRTDVTELLTAMHAAQLLDISGG